MGFKSSSGAIARFLNGQPISIKTACVEVLGTQRKTDVLRVLRVNDVLDYSANGTRHEIRPLGYGYFTYDAERRAAGQQLIPSIEHSSDWTNKAGVEIYISPLNMLRLKRDVLTPTVMQLIDPPSKATRNGIAADLAVRSFCDNPAQLDDLELPEVGDDDEAIVDDTVDPFRSSWLEQIREAARSGAAPAPHVRAGAYLTQRRVMTLLNVTAGRRDLTDREQALEHITNWCSFPMRQELELVFPTNKALDAYLERLEEMTAEAWLGYDPVHALAL